MVGAVVLAVVGFCPSEHAPAAERIAVAVDIPSRGTGVLETVGLGESVFLPAQGEQLGSAHPAFRMRVEMLRQRLQPARSDLHV